MSDAKAKLEALRQRKLALQKQMEDRKKGAASHTSAAASGSSETAKVDTSNYGTNSGAPKESFTRKSNLASAFALKKRNESLRSSTFSHSIDGIFPVLQENSSQYELPEELKQKPTEVETKAQEDKNATNKANPALARRFTKRLIPYEEMLKMQEESKEGGEEKKFLMNENISKDYLNQNEAAIDYLIQNSKDIIGGVKYFYLIK
ncbi:MAG: hypothetical protein MJ252_04340 [archaeon]|nr:hypothetical protein [archaeon]